MSWIRIASIIEGDGEVNAFPLLLKRVLTSLGCTTFNLLEPIRRNRSDLVDAVKLSKTCDLARRQHPRLVVLLLDADDDCRATLGPRLLQCVGNALPDIRHSVVVANREYESWFLASIDCLAGSYGLAPGLKPPPNFESIRDAKGWLGRNGVNGYKPTADQEPLTRLLNLDITRQRSDSFNKLWRELEAFVKAQRIS